MRVAALYDVHGNVRALDAVLAGGAAEADVVLFGGDLLWGPWPRETLELAQSLGSRATYIRGNWERYLLEGKDDWTVQHVSPEAVRAWPEAASIDGALYCHATPLSDEQLVAPELESSDWSSFTGPLVVCGHTHYQFDVERNGTRIVNPGSVGNPTIRATAWWAIVDGGDVELRTTDYDTAGAADAIRRSGFPRPDFADELLEPLTLEQLLGLVAG